MFGKLPEKRINIYLRINKVLSILFYWWPQQQIVRQVDRKPIYRKKIYKINYAIAQNNFL